MSENPITDPDDHYWNDVLPRRWCCEESRSWSSCYLFRQARPYYSHARQWYNPFRCKYIGRTTEYDWE